MVRVEIGGQGTAFDETGGIINELSGPLVGSFLINLEDGTPFAGPWLNNYPYFGITDAPVIEYSVLLGGINVDIGEFLANITSEGVGGLPCPPALGGVTETHFLLKGPEVDLNIASVEGNSVCKEVALWTENDIAGFYGSLFGGFANDFQFGDVFWRGDIEITNSVFISTVPEPGTLALLGLGLVGMAARRRKA